MNWKKIDTWWELVNEGIYITIEPRLVYCDRGNWIAKITKPGPLFIDGADGWPRYYFELKTAKREIALFLAKRNELQEKAEK